MMQGKVSYRHAKEQKIEGVTSADVPLEPLIHDGAPVGNGRFARI